MSNKKTITLSIDGREVVAEAGKTILDVARDNGVEIPTLCHDPRLPPYGSCLVCVVEVEGAKKPVLSCTTAAQEGQKITTQSEALFAARKNALDMLLSNHYANCRGACYEACPADVDVQGYLALAHEGRDKEALELIRETNPLPLVCGRVCVRYCEAACARNEIDTSPVAINFIKRYVSSLEHDNLDAPVKPESNGHKVAIVGGGPGGLSAAYYLAKAGCAVTIFEAHPKLGGMLRYGIPDYRLDQAIMDKEIQYILDYGVDVKTSTRLGRDFTLDDLHDQGYEAFFLALGAQKAKSMRVKNEDTEGVVGGVEFLDEVTDKGAPELSGHVLIVGGGNTAIDASRTALRCHADKVSILYRRTRKEMPADEVEVEDAIAEGVNVDFLVAPIEVLQDDAGKLRALLCQRMELGEPDASGRRRPVPIEGSEFEIECTMIVAAIGQDTDISGIRDNKKIDAIEESRWATINADMKSFATNVPGVFAGGDVVTGPEAAIDAIAHGRKAAEAMLTYLDTKVIPKVKTEFLSKQSNFGVPESYWERFEKTERATMRQVPAEERVLNFKEVDLGIDPLAVKGETARCISCGCSDVFTCELKQLGTEYDADQTRFAGKVMRFEPDTSHPFINLDPNKCIVCGRCVRTCDELQGVTALGFINRGFSMIVKPSMGKTLLETSCVSCGNCIEACPTGAISFSLPFDRPGPWTTEGHASLCNYCSVGCEIVYEKTNDAMWHVEGKKPDAWTPGELCVRGRFGHRDLLETRRLVEAKVRDGAEVSTLSLESAVDKAVAGMKAVADTHGAESLGFFISPKATNEEVFLFQKLAREVFGTKNVASSVDLGRGAGALDAMFGVTASTLSRKEVEEADVVVVVNADVKEDNPVLGFGVHRAYAHGAELIVVGQTSADLLRRGVRHLATKAGTNATLLAGLVAEALRSESLDRAALEGVEGFKAWAAANAATLAETAAATGVAEDAIRDVAALIADPQKNVVFVYGDDTYADKSQGDLEAIGALLLATGHIGRERNGLLLTHTHANTQGYRDLVGDRAQDFAKAVADKKLKGLFIFGEDLASEAAYRDLVADAEFVAVCDMFETETSALAHIALPGTAYAEAEGSVTALDRTVHTFAPAFPAPAGKTGFDVLAAIYAKAAGKEVDLQAVRALIAEANPRYAKLPTLATGDSLTWNENGGGAVLFGERFLTEDGKARFPVAATQGAEAEADAPIATSTIDRLFAELRAKKLAAQG